MKKINFLFGALAALAMGGAVTACSDDDLDKGIDNGVAEVDQTRYLLSHTALLQLQAAVQLMMLLQAILMTALRMRAK